MQGDEGRGRQQDQCAGTHTHSPTHRQRPGVSISAPTGGRENIREGPGVQETFQSFLSRSVCWEGLGHSYWFLCLCALDFTYKTQVER